MAAPDGTTSVHLTRSAVDRGVARLPPRLRWAAGALRLTLREPADGVDRILVRAREMVGHGRQPNQAYTVAADWHKQLHTHMGSPWPCPWTAEFGQLWEQVADDVHAEGVSLGRGTYGGWDDGDPGLARAIWCLMRSFRPHKVVETGVAHGVTSRIVLEALERAGSGHLWSIDLPAMDPSLHDQIGIAVPERLRQRWSYIAGTSRRRLPGLLQAIAPIDLFIHDSGHTERNMLFELRQAWPAISRGVLVADDIHQSAAFARFTASVSAADSYAAAADDAGALFGIVIKES